MPHFDDLLRTVEGRRLHEAQSWFQRRLIALTLLSCLVATTLAFIAVQGKRQGAAPNPSRGFSQVVALGAFQFGGMWVLFKQAIRRPGARCPNCGNPLIGSALHAVVNSGVCKKCKATLPYTAA
jgi:hypothetical protein